MKFKRKEMTDALTVIKRLIKDKKNGKISIQAKNDSRIYIKSNSEDEKCIVYHVITSLSEEIYSFSLNPYELDAALKQIDERTKREIKAFVSTLEKNGEDKKSIRAKEKELKEELNEIEFKLNQKSISHQETKNNIKIGSSEEDSQFYFDEEQLKELKEPEKFIQILKETNTVISKAKNINNSYLKITGEKALAAEEKQVHLFRVGEELPFKGGYLYKDYISLLATSVKKEFKVGIQEGFFIINNNGVYYLVKIEEKVQFPSFRNMKPIENEFSFSIDVSEAIDILSNYKKETPDLVITQDGGQLVFDPRNEEFPTSRINIKNVKGNFKKAIFDTTVLKSFFSGYEGEVPIEHQKFKNVYGELGYLWRIYTPEKLTMIAGIKEPEWEEIETHFKNGTIKELLLSKKKEQD